MTSAVAELAAGISADLQRRLPGQRKTQRDKLALLVATMLDARSANLMVLAASLPRPADRADMRYQWIARFIDNDLVVCDEVMQPFAREVLARAAAGGRVTLIMDQTKASDRHQILMLSLRFGERALPLAWRVEATQGAIGFAVQKQLLEAVAPWLPPQAEICLMADRFYGTPDLIAFAIAKGWGYRLRLKANPRVDLGGHKTSLAEHVSDKRPYLANVALTTDASSPTSASSTNPAMTSPGSSRCPTLRATSPRLTTAHAGASNRCSRISSRAGSGSNRANCAPLNDSPDCCW